MPREPKRTILVNRHKIAANKRKGTRVPVISVQRSGKRVQYAQSVDILDAQGNAAATAIYDPEHPRKCGATVWIESYHGVTLHDESPTASCRPDEFTDDTPLFPLAGKPDPVDQGAAS
jgi:hypothetical protein